LMTGVVARYALMDILVRVVGGGFDPDTATDIAFRTAAAMALKDAVMAAAPELIEPIMSLEIVTPVEMLGDLLGDINSRRGKISKMSVRGEFQVVSAAVPLAELFGYSTVVRSLTKGRATYTMEPKGFDIVPGELKQVLLAKQGVRQVSQ